MRRLIIPILITSYFLLPASTFAHGGVNDDELIIRMTENGFQPKELTVVEGDEVLFINNDNVDRWPASNFHPTHTEYPEFDPKKHIKPGESWTMAFEKVGIWRLHDHLIPHFTATIVVLQDPAVQGPTLSTNSQGRTLWTQIKAFFSKLFSAPSSKATRTGAKADEDLLSEFKNLDERAKYAWLEEIAASESPETAWRYVVAAYNTPQGVIGNPHDMAHLVGQLLFKEYGFDGLSTCEPIFAFGCYHGLMEVAFDKDRPEQFQERLAEARAGCEAMAESTSPSYWSCIHGIGHGIATFRDHDVKLSLADCSTLEDSIATYCYDGVFMEFSISAPANFYKQSDPLYPCNVIDDVYRTACGRSQVQVMKQRFRMGAATIANACLKSGSQPIAYHCIDAIGYFTAQESGGDARKIISGCALIADKVAHAQCLAAAAGELVFQNTRGWQESSKAVCESPGADSSCNVRIENVKKSYGRNQ